MISRAVLPSPVSPVNYLVFPKILQLKNDLPVIQLEKTVSLLFQQLDLFFRQCNYYTDYCHT